MSRKSDRLRTKDKPDAVSLLVASFHNGLTVRQACIQTGISHESYYTRLSEDSEFANKMYFAQEFTTMQALKNVTQAINNGDLKASMWFLKNLPKKIEIPPPKAKNFDISPPKTLKQHMQELQALEDEVAGKGRVLPELNA